MKRWLIIAMVIAVSLPVNAQEGDSPISPGHVDFGSLVGAYGEPRVMINIGGVLLKFMAAASREDPASQALIRDLEGVRVNVYNTAGELDPAREEIARVTKTLQGADWQPVVQVKEPGEEVQIFMKANEAGMQGLTVMAVNAEEAVFINIVGAIDPARLNTVLDNLNVGVTVGAAAQ